MYPRVPSHIFFTCSLLLISLPLGYQISSARTWNVFVDGTGDAPTVQAAVDSAGSEDSVLVHPGTYPGPINFKAKNIVLRSQSGPAATILDGTGLATPIVTISQGQNRAAKLEGFTIAHGSGGGVFMFDAGPSVIGNVITDNQGNAGGILCDASPNTTWFPLIQGNTITDNVGETGGVGTKPGVIPEIIDNLIARNGGSDGGGIYCRLGASGAVIRGNTLQSNQAYNDGGGIYIQSTAGAIGVEISWNLVSHNFAGGADFSGTGCGIDLVGAQAWVHHNTIVGNDGDGHHTRSVFGGGIAVIQAASPTIEQNIIAFNSPSAYSGTRAGGGIACHSSTPLIRNNFAWENEGGNVLGDCTITWESDGNVSDNPYFCDMSAGDLKVASNSGVMTHPAGPLGAFSDPGCGPVKVHSSTWGSLKARY